MKKDVIIFIYLLILSLFNQFELAVYFFSYHTFSPDLINLRGYYFFPLFHFFLCLLHFSQLNTHKSNSKTLSVRFGLFTIYDVSVWCFHWSPQINYLNSLKSRVQYLISHFRVYFYWMTLLNIIRYCICEIRGCVFMKWIGIRRRKTSTRMTIDRFYFSV